MHPLLAAYQPLPGIAGPLARAVPVYLTAFGLPRTAAHVAQVARQARRLAERFNMPPAGAAAAEAAGWLHDVSAVVPVHQRIALAEALELELLPEERHAPFILHQKLSREFARRFFGVTHAGALSAIGCHTTLKPEAAPLDQLVFLADKIAWDGAGRPAYLEGLLSALDSSLEAGARFFLDYLWAQRFSLPVVHPWLAAARA